MCIFSIFCVFLSFQAKYYQKLATDRERVLPYIQSESDLQTHIPKSNTLSHSKTDASLNKNGIVHNNFLLENMNSFEQVSLIPFSGNDRNQVDIESDLHSRGTGHVYNV